MECDTNRDRQDNEKAALKAIYAEQVTEVVSDSSKSWTPLESIIRLGPQVAVCPQLNSISSDLHIKCSQEYPLEPEDGSKFEP